MTVVFPLLITLVHPLDARFVIVIVVPPELARMEVVKVPVLPAVTVIVAVLPVAVFAPVRL